MIWDSMGTAWLRGQPRTARQLVELVERAITEGALRPGDRLPPVRELAEDADLAANTVAAAYRTLNGRGIVVGRGRAGTFVAARPPLATDGGRAAGATSRLPADARDLSSGSPDPALLCPLRPALERIDTEAVLYGADAVEPALQPWARRWAMPPGLADADTVRCAVVGGALDGVERVLLSHCRPGDRIAVEDPAYAAVLDLVAALGLVALPVAVDADGPLPQALEAALRDGAVAVVVTPRAQNPTGAVLGEARGAALRAVLAGHPDVLIVEDDHAGPVAGAPRRTLVTADRARWASIASVAKSLGPDLRLAFLAADPVTLGRVEGRQQLGTGWVSRLLQRVVLALLEDPGTEARLAHAARTYAARRARLCDALAEGGVNAMGRSGMNVWIPVAAEAVVLSELAGRGWWARAGEPYRMASPPAIRVTVADLDDPALDRLAADLLAVLAPAPTARARRIG